MQHRSKSYLSKKEWEVIHRLVLDNDLLVRMLYSLFNCDEHQRVALIFTTFINNSNYKIMSAQLNQDQFSLDTLQLIDADTQQVIADASFANVTFTSSDDSILTSVQDPTNPNQVTNTAIAPGTAQVSAEADVTYTDNKSGQSVTKHLSVSVDYEVIAVSTGEQNVALQIVQGTPQQQASVSASAIRGTRRPPIL